MSNRMEYSEHISAVFSRINAIGGVRNRHEERVSDGDLYREMSMFLVVPERIPVPKTGVLFIVLIYYPLPRSVSPPFSVH